MQTLMNSLITSTIYDTLIPQEFSDWYNMVLHLALFKAMCKLQNLENQIRNVQVESFEHKKTCGRIKHHPFDFHVRSFVSFISISDTPHSKVNKWDRETSFRERNYIKENLYFLLRSPCLRSYFTLSEC